MDPSQQFEVRRGMHIRLLGHVEASVDERPLSLGGAKQRAVLAMLGLEANRLVSADRLISGLWGEDPPPSAGKMVQNYVWRLRKVLGDGDVEIVTHGRGYELRIDRELIDVLRCERLVAQAVHDTSGDAARQALALYRGEPLGDIAGEPFAGAEIRRLEELRLTAAELAIDADLAAGRHHELVAEINALLAEHPLRERLHAQRMLALYRCGRQADALEAYRQARRTLVEEIGIEPGPELRRLHAAILGQDPALIVEAAVHELPPELARAAAAPMIGRERELRALRRLWRRAAAGDAAVVTVAGAYGMGKSRLAAELAREAHGEAATVLYAAGSGPGEAALAAVARAAEARGPTLLVLDDADRAPGEVRLAVRALGEGRRPLLAVATGLQAAALARLDPRSSVALEPLAGDAVRAIAAFYAPAGSEAPPAELLAATGGVPRRVHETAGEWARRLATERVDALAVRTAQGRSAAQALRSELADSVVELQSTLERIDAPAPRAPVVCPYKGLASFEADDAEYFFGREGLVAELVAHLVGTRLLAIVGPSGSGKSSVLRAGLLPALAGGVLPGSQDWAQAVIRPGRHPARALRHLPPAGVVAVDQFEELFTTCPDERERGEFVGALLELPRVVVAVRADFYGRCAAYPELSRALGANHVLVGPMTRDELGRVIERPARRAGLTVDPELTEALLADVEGEPGALPLLSTALLELWSHRDGRRLHLAAYARSGGVHGAVARLAEDAFVALPPDRQAAARSLLLRLSDEDAGGAVVRRRIGLDGQDPEIVARLSASRLLTVSEGSVEVAHEALLTEWPRLRGWLEEDREGRRLHHRLREAASTWEADGREPGGLYRGARLAAALEWAAEHDAELDAGEREFLQAGRRAAEAAQRRLRAGLAGVAALLALVVVAAVVALHQRDQARTRQTDADAGRLGAQALASDDLGLRLLLARQAVALHDTAQTRGDLLAALLASPDAVGVIRGVGQPAALALAPGGRTLLSLSRDGTLSFIDTRTGRPDAPARDLPGISGIAMDPSGDRLATTDPNAAVWDTRSWKQVAPLFAGGPFIGAVAFTGGGRDVLVLQAQGAGLETDLQRYDATTGAGIGPPHPVGLSRSFDDPTAMQVSADGRRVVTLTAGRLAVRDAGTLAPLWTLGDPTIDHVAMSPDGRTLIFGDRSGGVGFVDVPSGAVRRLAHSHRGPVVQVAFSPDGRTAASAGLDNRILLWDGARRTVRATLTGHSDTITGLVFGSRGRTLYSSGLDGKIIIWDLAGARRLLRPFGVDGPSAGAALSPDGRTIAVAHPDGTLTVVDAATLRARTLRVSGAPLAGAAFLDGAHVLATIPRTPGRPSGYGVVVDTRTGRTGPPLAGLGSPRPPSVDARGRRVALVWRGLARTGALVQPFAAGRPAGRARFYRRFGGVLGVAISPDGRTLAVQTGGGVELANAATMQINGFLLGSGTLDAGDQLPLQARVLRGRSPGAGAGTVGTPRFFSGGRLLAVGSRDGWVRLWSPATSRAVSPRLAAHSGPVASLAVSPDGRTLASGGTDGIIHLIDLGTRQPLSARLPVAAATPATALFARNGAYLFALTASGRGYRLDFRPSAWERRACAVAGRRLTAAEWAQLLPGRPYRPAC